MSARIAIGFGATSAALANDVVRLIEAALASLDARDGTIATVANGTLLATLDRRARLGREVGAILGCELVTFDAAGLARIAGAITVSSLARERTGTASVAEAAALAALGSHARLVATRTTGRYCTCAIAKSA